MKCARTLKRSNHNTMHKANLLLCTVVLVIISGYLFSNHLFESLANITGTRTAEYISYKVGSGDTLWKLASQAVTPDEDVRDKIIAIQKLNNMSATQALSPGQIIMIPVASASIDQHRYALMSR